MAWPTDLTLNPNDFQGQTIVPIPQDANNYSSPVLNTDLLKGLTIDPNLYGSGGGKASGGLDLGFNKGTFDLLSSGLSGLGQLAAGWAALKQLDLAKDAFNTQKDFANKQYGAMRTTVNNQIADQNAWKSAQGRTDLSKLVV